MVRTNSAGRSPAAHDDEAWFAPKRYGYGSSLPISWQGWAVMLAYFAGLALAAWLILPRSLGAFIPVVLGLTAAFVLVCARKTRGGWHWRWGGDA